MEILMYPVLIIKWQKKSPGKRVIIEMILRPGKFKVLKEFLYFAHK